MIVPLINCPSWHLDYPPYNISLLKAILTQNGFDAICFDFNLDFYTQITDNIKKESWQHGSCWEYRGFVVELIEKYRNFIEDYILKIVNLDSRVVCFTVNKRNRYFTYIIAEMLKEIAPEKKIIFGGPSCYISPRINILSESCADAICLGEGEISLVNFLKIIELNGTFADCPGFAYKTQKGEIIDCGDGTLLEDLSLLPFADFSDFNISKYLTNGLSILTSKGCNNTCSFCSERPKMRKYRVRPAEKVFSEILHQLSIYPNIKQFWFNDSLINGDIAMLDTFCSLLIDHNINILWGGQATIKKDMSLDLLSKMKRAGCYSLSYGLENGSNKILRLMKKGYNAALAERVLRDTYEAGIGVSFNIIVGFPGETEKEFQETVDFIRRNMKYTGTVTLNPLYFEEGSELSLKPQKWNICVDKENSVYGWVCLDGINNLQERLRRLNVLCGILNGKGVMGYDQEFVFNLNQGDRLLQEGKKEESLKYYLMAKEKNQDENINRIIKEKLSTITEIKQRQKYDKIQNIEKPISFCWDLHYACNYRCPYCWWHSKWQDLTRLNRYFSVGELVKYWINIYNKYGLSHIEVLGGEPFIYPKFKELIGELSRMHTLGISTNLSTNIEDFALQIDSGRVKINPTFHPVFSRFDIFIKKIKFLKEKGFTSNVYYLAYPPQIRLIEYYRHKFDREGIPLAVMTFWGKYNGIDYPDGYTKGEINIIKDSLAERAGEKFQIIPKKDFKGKLCHAGQSYAVIQADGTVIRCGGSGLNEIIGNFFDENFKMLDKPLPCEAEYCKCNEWAFLLE